MLSSLVPESAIQQRCSGGILCARSLWSLHPVWRRQAINKINELVKLQCITYAFVIFCRM